MVTDGGSPIHGARPARERRRQSGEVVAVGREAVAPYRYNVSAGPFDKAITTIGQPASMRGPTPRTLEHRPKRPGLSTRGTPLHHPVISGRGALVLWARGIASKAEVTA
ncbi:hypothetical protein GCM10022206_22920 [Streptomyces chiangmaiensis]